MRQSVLKISTLLAVLASACGDPTGVGSVLNAPDGVLPVVTSDQGSISKQQGDNLIGQTNAFLITDPTVRVVNTSGAAISGEAVTFVTTDGSTLSNGATSFTVNTNSNGQAATRWRLGTIGGHTLTATVGTGGVSTTFNAIATTSGNAPTIAKVQGDRAQDNNDVMAGRLVRTNPTVEVIDDGSTAKLNRVIVTFTPNSDGTANPPTATTAAVGGVAQAATSWRFATTTTAQTLTVRTLATTNNAGSNVTPAVFSKTSRANGSVMNAIRTGQTATTANGSQFGPKNPAVQILTAAGAPVAGARVIITFGAGSSNCDASTADDAGDANAQTFLTYTDAAGVAATRWCNTSTGAGTRTVTFTADDLSATITGTVNAGAAASMSKQQGDGTTGTVGTVVSPADPAVRLVDAQGSPVANAAITFTASGNGTVANGTNSSNSIVVNTDANGVAAVRWTRGTVSGAQTLTATLVSDNSITVTFNTTATAGAAAAIVRLKPEVLQGTRSNPTNPNPAVRINDQYGNRIQTAVTVTFTPSAGSSVAPASVTSGGNYPGQPISEAATQWTLGATSGSYTLTVSVAGAPSITFTGTTTN